MNYSSDRLSNNYYDALIKTRFLENNNKMAENVRGTIQQVPRPREFVKGDKVTHYYSIKVNDVYYSTGTKKPPAEGTLVEFAAEKNARGYWDITKAGITIIPGGNPSSSVGASAVSSASTAKLSKDDYWNQKEKRDLEWQHYQRTVVQPKIEIQAARNAAIEFVKLLITPVGVDKDGAPAVALKLPANVSKREEVLFEAVKKYTEEFVQSNQSISSENNNKNEQLSQDQADREENRSTESGDEAWNV